MFFLVDIYCSITSKYWNINDDNDVYESSILIYQHSMPQRNKVKDTQAEGKVTDSETGSQTNRDMQ